MYVRALHQDLVQLRPKMLFTLTIFIRIVYLAGSIDIQGRNLVWESIKGDLTDPRRAWLEPCDMWSKFRGHKEPNSMVFRLGVA